MYKPKRRYYLNVIANGAKGGVWQSRMKYGSIKNADSSRFAFRMTYGIISMRLPRRASPPRNDKKNVAQNCENQQILF